MQAKKICFFCFRKIWQVFAVTLVVMAVLVSVLKYTLPYVNDYKHNIETLINEQFGVDITIGAISASWQGAGPALVLENLTFADNQNAPIALSIARTSLQLNILDSLKNWQLRSNYFVLEGFVADINLPELNQLQSERSEFEQQSLIESLFLGDTGHFAIQKSQINLITAIKKRHSILLEDITWQNSEMVHEGVGEVSIPGFTQGHYSARISFTGGRLRELDGQVYLRASKVDVTDWLTQYLSETKENIHTDLNGELWLSMRGGLLSSVHLNWLPSEINWYEDGAPQQLSFNEGQVLLTPAIRDKNWQLNTMPFQIQHDDITYPAIQIQGEFASAQQQIWFDNVSLGLLTEVSALTNFSFVEQLGAHEPSGTVSGRLGIDTSKQFSMSLAGDDISWQQVDGIPGAEKVRVDFSFAHNAGAVSFF